MRQKKATVFKFASLAIIDIDTKENEVERKKKHETTTAAKPLFHARQMLYG